MALPAATVMPAVQQVVSEPQPKCWNVALQLSAFHFQGDDQNHPRINLDLLTWSHARDTQLSNGPIVCFGDGGLQPLTLELLLTMSFSCSLVMWVGARAPIFGTATIKKQALEFLTILTARVTSLSQRPSPLQSSANGAVFRYDSCRNTVRQELRLGRTVLSAWLH